MSARSHGISCTSFLVYSPDLPIQVTIAYLDFAVFGQLVPCTRLNIRFLFVEPRFRYVFLSPPLTEVSFDSRYRVHRQQVPQGNCTPDVQHARRTKKSSQDGLRAYCLSLDQFDESHRGSITASVFCFDNASVAAVAIFVLRSEFIE